jgi:hypothetical protein
MKNNFLSDSELLVKTQIAAKTEKTATFELLKYLVEVDERRAYATLACSTLFEYVTKILGYSEMQASERINSVRLMRAIPEVKSKIESGDLSMSTASQVQRFLRQEKKTGNAILKSEALHIVNTCAHQSKREVEKTLFSLASTEAKVSAERIKEVSEEYTELKFLISESTFSKLAETKNLIGNESLKDIFDLALDALLTQIKKKKGMKTKPKTECEPHSGHHSGHPDPNSNPNSNANPKLNPVPEPIFGTKVNFTLKSTFPGKLTAGTSSRFISIRVKRKVHERSNNQCEFVDPQTKVRCTSRHRLQFDHYPIPFAKGGNNHEENIRHLCFQHNQKSAMRAGLGGLYSHSIVAGGFEEIS